MKVVVTLTTLPDRLLNDKILLTLESLRDQTRVPDQIVLGIPPIAKRFNKPYPEPSEKIKSLATIIKIDQDYGPVTKILGALFHIRHPDNNNSEDTIIITVDDDNVYNPTFIERMLKAHEKRPTAAIGSAGVVVGSFPGYFAYIRNEIGSKYEAWWGEEVPEEGQQMDILCGYAGILYLRSMFPEIKNLKDDFLSTPLENSSVFLHDDVYVSCYLNSQGYERWLYEMPQVSNPRHHSDSLSGDMWDFYPKLMKAYKFCSDKGMIKSKVQIKYRHTVTGRVLIAILMLILIVFIIVLFLKFRKRFHVKL